MSSSPTPTSSTLSTPIDPADHPLHRSLTPLLPHNQPICIHLNADTSWLILVPHPSTSNSTSPASYFIILLDPWFTGFDGSGPIFQTILYAEKHNIPSSVQSISELESILTSLVKSGQLQPRHDDARNHSSPIDLVIVSNDNGDHCHRPTLRQLPRSISVLALPLPHKIIQGYDYFTNLHAVKAFTSCVPEGAETTSLFGLRRGTPKALDWRLANYSHAGLPDWLGVAYTTTPGERPPFHTPLMIAFPKQSSASPSALSSHPASTSKPSTSPSRSTPTTASAIIYLPHGAPPSSLTPFSLSSPPLHTLAILGSLHRVWLTPHLLKISAGARGAIDLIETLDPDYWIATHDEVKETTAKGVIVPALLRREVMGLEDLKKLARERGVARRFVGTGERSGDEGKEGEQRVTKVLVPGSGEACVLGEVLGEEVGRRILP